MKLIGRVASMALAFAVFALPARANLVAVTTTSTVGTGALTAATTIGWKFSIAAPINVTDLGVFDSGLDGLAYSHQVGIWDSLNQLVVSGTVAAGTADPLLGGFRYDNITPVTLAAGIYMIGAFYEAGSSENFLASATGFASNVTVLNGNVGYYSGSTSFSVPNISAGFGAPGLYGPNFQFVSAPVPEPGSLVLVGLALCALTVRRRHQ